MILSLLVVARVVSAATYLQREAHFSRERYVIEVNCESGRFAAASIAWARETAAESSSPQKPRKIIHGCNDDDSCVGDEAPTPDALPASPEAGEISAPFVR